MTLPVMYGARRLMSLFWLGRRISAMNQAIELDNSGNARSLILPRGNAINLNAMNTDLGDDISIMAANPDENFLMSYNTNWYATTYPWRRTQLYYCDCLVKGEVRSYFTGLPVEGFLINIAGRTGLTNSMGQFEVIIPFVYPLTGTQPSFTVTGSKTGYESYVKKVGVQQCDPMIDFFCFGDGFFRFLGNANDYPPPTNPFRPYHVIKEEAPTFTPSVNAPSYDTGVLMVYEEHVSGVITDMDTGLPIANGFNFLTITKRQIEVTGAPMQQNTAGVYRLNPFDPDYAPTNPNPISITASEDYHIPKYLDHVQANVQANYTGTRQYDFAMDPI